MENVITANAFLSEYRRYMSPEGRQGNFSEAFLQTLAIIPTPEQAGVGRDENSVTAWVFKNLRYDFHTSANQKILRKLVEREDFRCQSSLVEHLLDLGVSGISRDNIEGGENYRADLSDHEFYGTAGELQTLLDELREKLEALEEQACDENEEERETLQSDIEALEDADMDNPEVMEWWLCDNWMMKKLEEEGEAILRTDFEDWWGRQASGQAIYMDSVFAKIAFDMEILEFQANDWSKYPD